MEEENNISEQTASEETSSQEPEQKSQKSNKNIIIGVLVVVVLLILGGAYYFLFMNKSESMVVEETNTTGNTVQETNQTTDEAIGEEAQENTAMDDESTEMTDALVIEVEGSDFKFDPNTFEVVAGEDVKLVFKSVDGFHDLVFDDLEVATKQVSTGQETVVEFTAPVDPGEYAFYCSVGNHRAMGMEGIMVVN